MGDKKPESPAAEMTRRGAAGLARSTAGRSRCLDPDRKKYDRRRDKKTGREDDGCDSRE